MVSADYVWMNGEFVAFEDAKVHVLTHALHYGTSVFEGVRCYETEKGPAVFRHKAHLDRLFQSARLYHMEIPFSPGRDQARDGRADRAATTSAAATSGRWSSAAPARWACTRSTRRSRS